MGIAHLAVELSLRHQGRDRIHYQHVHRTRLHQGFRDLQSLLTIVRLRDQQVIYVYAQLLGVARIKRMLSVHKSRQAAHPLRLCDDLQRNGRLT